MVAVHEREVLEAVERFGDEPGLLLPAYPDLGIDAPQVVGHRVLAQRLVVAPVGVLVEVRHRKLPHGAVHRVAPAQPDAVGLRDRAPAAVAPEERDDVVEIAHRAHVQEERRLAMHPERARSKYGPKRVAVLLGTSTLRSIFTSST